MAIKKTTRTKQNCNYGDDCPPGQWCNNGTCVPHAKKPGPFSGPSVKVAGAIIGAIVTLFIQSSSATVGMAILLTKKGFLSLTGGIAIMLGAELGTCSDTIIATIRGSRAAIKTGLFHVSFNLLSICLGLILFTPFVVLVNKISAGTSIERALANAHMIFNVSGVLLFAWTLPFFEKILNKLIPEKVAS